MRFRPWLWCLLAGALLVTAEGILGDSAAADVVHAVISTGAIVTVLLGVRHHRPRHPAPWLWLAGGALLWFFGDALRVMGERPITAGTAVDYADLLHLAGYVVLIVALVRLARRTDLAGGIDALIVGVAVAATLWTALVRPAAPLADLGADLVRLAYPALAAVVVAYLLHLALAGLYRSPSLRLMGLGFAVVLAGDLLHQVAQTYGLEIAEQTLLPVRAAGYVLWAAAALHPSMRTIGRPQPADGGLLRPSRIAVLVAACLTLPAIVFAEMALDVDRQPVVVAVFAVLLVVLVGVRFRVLVQRMRTQSDQLTHAVGHDFLTGLLTRRALLTRLAEASEEVRAGGSARPALIVVGLERFQEFSTTLGHRIGDELLRAVGIRLPSTVDAPASFARLGGDVFAALIDDARDADALLDHARSVARAVREPFTVSDLEVDIDAGVGVVRVPDHGTDPAQLLHRADVALLAARTVKSRVAVWHPLMEAGGALASELMSEIADAAETGQLVVHFQPQLDVRTGKVPAVEALVRWNHPVHGLLGPASFIPAAERTGQIRAVTGAVLDQALALVAASRASGRHLAVSVNLSVRNLLDPRLVADIGEALTKHDVDPALLELEITETSAMVEPDRSAAALLGLVDLGATISIDDYGTGYGSLAYLQNLPIDRLKIDRSFVGRVCHDAPSAAIVRSVVELSSRLGLTCVAEGVEDDETLLALQDMGCEMAQGFGLARPVPADRLIAVVTDLERRMEGVLGVRATLP